MFFAFLLMGYDYSKLCTPCGQAYRWMKSRWRSGLRSPLGPATNEPSKLEVAHDARIITLTDSEWCGFESRRQINHCSIRHFETRAELVGHWTRASCSSRRTTIIFRNLRPLLARARDFPCKDLVELAPLPSATTTTTTPFKDGKCACSCIQ